MEDVRWKQRYDNLRRAFRKLEIGLRIFDYAQLQQGFIADHDGWRKMVFARNKTSHTYDEAMADEITADIVNIFYPLMEDLYGRLTQEYHG